MNVIDAFCGCGGLSLGFQMCGHDVVYGIDNNRDAIETFSKNFPGAVAYCGDIEKLNYMDLPDADVIVGGPPCVNFSTSKGSRANVLQGLKLVQAFLRLVWVKQPRYWIMENVPRVGLHLPEKIPLRWIGVDRDGWLDTPVKHEFLISEYGAPQNRTRLLIGNYPVPAPTHTNERDLFTSSRALPKTLGDVITSLSIDPVVDPNYGISIPRSRLSDHIKLFLSSEEAHRIKQAKNSHPYMGWMPFPDRLDKPARTVVALQMGRETLVIKEGRKFRRATVRECATLQAFPITFHFHGKSIESRYKQAGNAVPPILSFSIAKEITHIESGKRVVQPVFYEGPLASVPTMRKKKERKFNLGKPIRILFPGKEIRGFRIELVSNPQDYRWNAVVFEGEGKANQKKFNIDAIAGYAKQLCTDAGLDRISDKIITLTDAKPVPSGKELHTYSHENPTKTHPFILGIIDTLNKVMPRAKNDDSVQHSDSKIFGRKSIRTRMLVSIVVCLHIINRINDNLDHVKSQTGRAKR